MTSSASQAVDGVRACGCCADRVDRHVAATTGEVVHLGDHIATIGEDGVLCPQAPRQVQSCGGAVDCHNPGACGNGDLHGAQAHTADPDHRDPLVAPYARSGIQRAVGGSEPAAKCSGRGILNDIGDCDQVGVSRMQGHVLGEGAPVRETRLGLVWAHLSLSVQAPLAGAAAAHERCRDSVADRPSSYVGAHRSYDADQLVTWYVGKMYPVVVPGPCMPVTAAKAGTVHLHDDARG